MIVPILKLKFTSCVSCATQQSDWDEYLKTYEFFTFRFVFDNHIKYHALCFNNRKSFQTLFLIFHENEK